MLRPMKVSTQLAEATMLTLKGKSRRFDTLYAERPAVVFWLRHYG